MLVLSRGKSEQVLIGNEIVITIVEIKGGKVRLGIDAPKSIPICRQKLLCKNKLPGHYKAPEDPKP